MTGRGRKRLLALFLTLIALAVAASGAYLAREAHRNRNMARAYRDGMTAYDARDYELAMKRLGSSLPLHREDPEVLYRIADARRRFPTENNRHLTMAVSFLREALTFRADDHRCLELLLSLYRSLGFLTERLEVADRLLAIEPGHDQAHLARIECLVALGRNQTAGKAIDDFLALHPQNLEGQQWRIDMMRHDAATPDQIIEYVDQLTAQWPDNVALATLRIRTLASFGKRDEARAAAGTALTLDCPDTRALLDLVRTVDLIGMRAHADQLLDRAVNDERFRDDVQAYLIERAWKAGQSERARQQVNAANTPVSQTPSNLLGWMTLAQLPVDSGWQSTTTGAELAARSDDKARYWSMLLAGRQEFLQGRYSEARRDLSEALSINDTDSLGLTFLGQVAQRLGEPELAVSSLRQAVNLDDSSSRARMLLAASLLDTDQIDEARYWAQRAFVMNPAAPEALTLVRVDITMLDRGAGDRTVADQAVNIISQMSRQSPEQVDLQALLARTYLAADRMDEGRKTIESLSRADHPPAAPILTDLAQACRVKAPDLLETLLALAHSDPAASSPELLAMQVAADQQQVDETTTRRLYREAIDAQTDSMQRLKYEIAYAQYLDTIAAPDAMDHFRQIAQDYPDQPDAQKALLDSRAAWTDEPAISAAIDRLQKTTGPKGTRWRLAQAQRKLTFDPDDSDAADVVILLGPLTRPPMENTRALVLTSEALQRLGDRDGAIQMLNRALERDARNPLLYAQTIDLLQAQGRSSEAATRLREFTTMQNLPPPLLRRRIDLLTRQAMWSEAVSDCQALVARTGRPEDLKQLAILEAGSGRQDDARKIFDQLLAAPEVDSSIRITAADFFAKADGLERGLEVLKPLESEIESGQYAAALAAFYERNDQIDDAVHVLENRARQTQKADDWANLVELLVRNRRIDHARRVIDQALAVVPDHVALLALRGVVDSLESGRLNPDSVQGIVATLVDPSLRPAMTRIADAMQYLQEHPTDLTGYVERLRKVVVDEPAFLLGWQLLAGALLENNQPDDALTAAKTAARILPASVRAAELLAATSFSAGQYDEARISVRQWKSLDPESPSRADILLAQIESDANHPQNALTALQPWVQRIQDEADQYPTRLALYAQILIQAGRTDEAHDLIWPRAQADTNWAQAYVRLASHAIRSAETAIQWVDRAQPLIPLTPDTRAGLAQVRVDLGRRSGRPDQYGQAINLLEPMVADPATPGLALGILAGGYQGMGQTQRAEATYRRALKITPEDAVLKNNLADLLLQNDKNAHEALDLAGQAVAAAQQQRYPAAIRANILDTLGMAQLSLARSDDAVQTFRTALALDSQNPMLRLGLAQALARSGKTEDAQDQYRQVTSRPDLDRENPDLARRLEHVANLFTTGP